jgi:hypothetical protein
VEPKTDFASNFDQLASGKRLLRILDFHEMAIAKVIAFGVCAFCFLVRKNRVPGGAL